ncbi:MAG: hypothetical protein M0R46_13900 [Candidatus Muirbacterium halophilum]|nr:hypothetical protein [Candidatus Muirbacterium halophilum]
MKTKFYEFLNEYGGPGRTIGFRYSDPVDEYGFLIYILVDTEYIDADSLREDIKDILVDNKIGEDYFDFTLENDYMQYDVYKLEIGMKGYSKYELQSLIGVVLDAISEMYSDEIDNERLIIVGDQLQVKGPDVDIEPTKKSKIGF